ncbi:metal-dependent hydrolase [Virgibacillus phasianinus]|uniref:Metal-dependent hydrolase n=1 Tax=Virgibacillus phasianinus TaxID=2017483 RepID=A0A220U929_9BACI|nr:metal-dependent hydrolase [Virgibacillus phasianinus]
MLNNVRLFRPFVNDSTEDVFHIEIDGEKIQGVHKGLTDEAGTHVVDCDRRVVAAGFNDSHMHLLRYGLMKMELDFRSVTSFEEMKNLITNRYNEAKMEEHDWVVGRGLIDSQLTDIDHPLTADDLEELEYNKPAFFLHEDGHECVVNYEALKILKQEPKLLKNHETFIETDDNGNWTGRFKDTAVHFIKFNFRQKGEEEIYEAVRDAVPHLLENGITSVHTDDLNFVGNFERLRNTYLDLEKDGHLKIDVHLHHYIFNIDDLRNFLRSNAKRTGDGSERVKVGAIKIFLDGTQRLHTSALRQAYHDKPDTAGELVYSQDELNEIVQTAHENGMQVAMHAIGDRTVEQSLNALEQVNVTERRHRIIHAQVLAPDLLERLQEVKPYIETQPGFIMNEYDQTVNWVGEDQEKYCNPWNTVDNMEIPFTLSSDTPIGPLSPITGIFAGVNRTDTDGNPNGGWIPDERLSIDSSFQGYSQSAAELEFREHEKGSLEAGQQADLILLSEHPKEMQPSELNSIEVVETWSRGERVFQKD